MHVIIIQRFSYKLRNDTMCNRQIRGKNTKNTKKHVRSPITWMQLCATVRMCVREHILIWNIHNFVCTWSSMWLILLSYIIAIQI